MRHGKRIKKLGVNRSHRVAMLSNLANSLISHSRIKTTTTRAKVLQGKVERLITLAKKGDLHARRQVYAVLKDRRNVNKLFDEIAGEFKNTTGGYTRRAFYGRRLGDGASLSIVELNIEKKVVEETKGKKGKKAESAKGETRSAKKTTKKTAKKATKKKTAKKKSREKAEAE
jgi:large subunit ribosomal protein L17